jgi:hypothetical protein
VRHRSFADNVITPALQPMAVMIDASQVAETRREGYLSVLFNAIDLCRPFGEEWEIVLSEAPDGTTLQIDFKRGTEPRQTLTIATDATDTEHDRVFRSVCQFLRRNWSGGLEPP